MMDHRGTASTNRARMAQSTRRASSKVPSTSASHGLLHYDSDASSTLESMKNLMAANLRGDFQHGGSNTRNHHHKHSKATTTTTTTTRRKDEDDSDILFSAKFARAQMPRQFREPPSSTGSHGTITQSSLGDDGEDTADSASTFSAGPDAESTRASIVYERGSHRVHKSTGRFDSNTKNNHVNNNKNKKDPLSGVVNTSALFRTFKEWKPEDYASESDMDNQNLNLNLNRNQKQNNADTRESTTNFALVEKLDRHFDKENCVPFSSPLASTKNAKNKSPLATRSTSVGAVPLAPSSLRRNRAFLQATVQNESDLSMVMSTAVHQKNKSPVMERRMASPVLSLSHSHSLSLEDPPSPETAPNSQEEEEEDLAVVLPPLEKKKEHQAEKAETQMPKMTPTAETLSVAHNDTAGNQSFLVSAQSYPLLHNLVSGTLRFTPGAFFYGAGEYQLPPGPLPEDEKKIFIDVEKIRSEVMRLQEHDEMLQNEIVQGERKYQSLLQRFYGLAQRSSDSGIGGSGSGSDSSEEREREKKAHHQALQKLHTRIAELETSLDVLRTQHEEQTQMVADAKASRDAAKARAAALAEQNARMATDLEALREHVATTTTKTSRQESEASAAAAMQAAQAAQAVQTVQTAHRRIQQLERMVDERDHVVESLRTGCKTSEDAAEMAEAAERKAQSIIQRLEEQLEDMATRYDEAMGEDTEHSELEQKVQRQQSEIAKLQNLLRTKEASVRELDANFQRLRASWTAKDETLMRLNEVLGNFGEEDHEEEKEKENENEHEHENGHDVNENDNNDDDSLSNRSMDENMTSAFILPDIDFAPEEMEDHVQPEGTRTQEITQEVTQEVTQATQATQATEPEMTEPEVVPDFTQQKSSKKSVAFDTQTQTGVYESQKSQTQSKTQFQSKTQSQSQSHTHTQSQTTCVNCVVCRQDAAKNDHHRDAKVTVAVPRPIPQRQPLEVLTASSDAREHHLFPAPDMDPGKALAFVMKLLEDERRHLWQAMASTWSGADKPADDAWRAYLRKVEQLNRLEDVLAGQRMAGQAMTAEQMEVTITRILGV